MEHIRTPLASHMAPTAHSAQPDTGSHKIVLAPLPELDGTNPTIERAHYQLFGDDDQQRKWKISSLEYHRDHAIAEKQLLEARCMHRENRLKMGMERNLRLEDYTRVLSGVYKEKARLEEEVDDLKEREAEGRERCEGLEAEADVLRKELKESHDREGKEKEKYAKLEGEVKVMRQKIHEGEEREREFEWLEETFKREKAQLEERIPRSTTPGLWELELCVDEQVVAHLVFVLALLCVIVIAITILAGTNCLLRH